MQLQNLPVQTLPVQTLKARSVVRVPQFPECQHPIIQALSEETDAQLIELFQNHPTQGQYFVAIFCRYHSIIYRLIHQAVRSPVQADYLFAMVWKHLHHQLQGLNISGLISQPDSETGQSPTVNPDNISSSQLQSWLVETAQACITQTELPPVESIHYSLSEASPPFLYYLEQSLERLSPLHRLVVLMTQTFRWNAIRIAAYLQAEGTIVSEEDVKHTLSQGYQSLIAELPDDICEIYALQLLR